MHESLNVALLMVLLFLNASFASSVESSCIAKHIEIDTENDLIESPISDSNRKYRKKFAVPKVLLRVTKIPPDNLFRPDGFVKSHAWTLSGDQYRSLARTTPMIHPEDISVIKNLFRHHVEKSKDGPWVLVIDPKKVKHLSNAEHSKLEKNGEYFGEIPRDAVMKILPLNQYAPSDH